jgi:hypothetical protein
LNTWIAARLRLISTAKILIFGGQNADGTLEAWSFLVGEVHYLEAFPAKNRL